MFTGFTTEESDTPLAAADREQLNAPPLPGETPADTRQRFDQQAIGIRVANRVKAQDLAQRGVAFNTDPVTGRVNPVRDSAGGAITGYDKGKNIGYDSSGNAVQVKYGETGPPVVEDAFSGIPVTTDPKTGDQYQKRAGAPWRWTGRDQTVADAAARKEQDRIIGQTATALGRKLTLDEADTKVTQHEHQKLAKDLLAKVPVLAEAPDADATTATKLADDYFNSQYADPAANRTTFMGFGRELTPEAAEIRTKIDADKADAFSKIGQLHDLSTKLREKQDAARATRTATEAVRREQSNRDMEKLRAAGVEISGLTQEPQLPSPPPTESMRAETPAEPSAGEKHYSVDEQHGVTFTPDKLTAGVAQAAQDGAIDPKWVEDHGKEIADAQAKYDELVKAAGSAQVLKALLHGGGRGAAFLAGYAGGSPAGAAIGAPVGTFIGGVLGAPTGPGEAAAIPAGATIGAGIGSVLGGLSAGTLASFSYGKGMEKLSEYSDAVKSLTASAQLHPIANATGELVAFGSAAPKAIGNLARLGGIAKAAAVGEGATEAGATIAGAKAIGKTLAHGAVGGALFEGALRPAFDAARYVAADSLGISHDEFQPPTVGSLATNVALGVLLAGRSIKFRDYSAKHIADIMSSVDVRESAGIPPGKEVSIPEIVEAFKGRGIDLDSAGAEAMRKPVTKEEFSLYQTLKAQTKAMQESGAFDDATGVKFEGAKQAVIPGLKPGKGTQISAAVITPERAEPSAKPAEGPIPRLPESPPAEPAAPSTIKPVHDEATPASTAEPTSDEAKENLAEHQRREKAYRIIYSQLPEEHQKLADVAVDKIKRGEPLSQHEEEFLSDVFKMVTEQAQARKSAEPSLEPSLEELGTKIEKAKADGDSMAVALYQAELKRRGASPLSEEEKDELVFLEGRANSDQLHEEEFTRLQALRKRSKNNEPTEQVKAPAKASQPTRVETTPAGQPATTDEGTGETPAVAVPAVEPGGVEIGGRKYTPAIQLADGTTISGESHPAIETKRLEEAKVAGTGLPERGKRGYVTPEGEFIGSLTEIARREEAAKQPISRPSAPVESPTKPSKKPATESAPADETTATTGSETVGKLPKGVTFKRSNPKDYSKSSTQVTLPKKEAQIVRDFADTIPESEIYSDPDDPTFGRESDPHITALYGIKSKSPQGAAGALAGHGPIKVKLGKLSLFKNEKYDVLKADVESEDLHGANRKLREGVDFENDFPDYHPHMTVAYLKPGQGDKYVGKTPFAGKTFTFNELEFRAKDGAIYGIDLGKGSSHDHPLARHAQGSMATHAEELKALGHPVKADIGDTTAANESGIATVKGRITIDPQKLEKATSGMDANKRGAYIKHAIAEEVLHVGFHRFINEADENRQRALAIPGNEPEAVAILRESYPGFDDLPEVAKAAEVVRLIMQGRTGATTESTWKFIKDLIARLRAILGKLTASTREVIDEIDRRMGRKPPEQKAPTRQKPKTVAVEKPSKSKPVDSPSSVKLTPAEQALKDALGDLLSAGKPDSGKPEDGETPAERLTREAEQANILLSLETIKGLLREDPSVMKSVRDRIQAVTGNPAIHAAEPQIFDTPIPKEKMRAITAAAMDLALESNTAEQFAASLQKMGDKALKYSQALWFIAKAGGATGDDRPDWSAIYGASEGAAIESPKEAVEHVKVAMDVAAVDPAKPVPKDVREEALSQLRAELEKAPSEESLSKSQRESIQTGSSAAHVQGKKQLDEAANAVGSVTVDIQGDGEFTILRTKEAIQEAIDRLSKMSAQPKFGAPSTGGGIGRTEPQIQAGMMVEGMGKEAAIAELERQLKQATSPSAKSMLQKTIEAAKATAPEDSPTNENLRTSGTHEEPSPETGNAGTKSSRIAADEGGEIQPGGPEIPSEGSGSATAAKESTLSAGSPEQKATEAVEKIAPARKSTRADILDARNAALKKGGPLLPGAIEAMKGVVKYFRDGVMEMPKSTPLDQRIGIWQADLQVADRTAQLLSRAIKQKAPNALSRMAMMRYMDTGGDEAVMRAQMAASKPAVKKIYERALSLSAEEKQIIEHIEQLYSELGDLAIDAGLLKNSLENYVSRYVDKSTLGEEEKEGIKSAFSSMFDSNFPQGKIKTRFDHAMQRTNKFIFDLEQKNIGLRTQDVAEVVAAYSQAVAHTIAHRALVRDLTKVKAEDGRAIAALSGYAKPIEGDENDPGVLIVKPSGKPDKFDKEGKVTEEHGDYQPINHPAFRKFKRIGEDADGKQIMLESDMLIHPEAYQRLKNTFGTSALNKIPGVRAISTAQYVAKQIMLGWSAFHVVQTGTHFAASGINPFVLHKVNLDDPITKELMNAGMNLFRFDAQQHFGEGLAASGFARYLGPLGKLNDAITGFTFEEYIPGLIDAFGKIVFARNLKRFAKELAAGTMTREQVAQHTAAEANAAGGFGNERYEGDNPTRLHAERLFLLAPRFLKDRIDWVRRAFTKHGVEERRSLLILALTMAITAKLLERMLTGKNDWEKPFSVVTQNREYELRSVPGDILELIQSPRRFANGRLSPLISRPILNAITGRDYRGVKRDMGSQLMDILKTPIPISVKGFIDKDAPELNPGESLVASMGLRTRRHSDLTETKILGHDWQKKNGLEDDASIFPPSKYIGLRNALEDGNEQSARAHYRDLLKTMPKEKLDAGFKESLLKPFSGTKKNEDRFSASLHPEDRATMRRAISTQSAILARFTKISNSSASTKSEGPIFTGFSPTVKKSKSAIFTGF